MIKKHTKAKNWTLLIKATRNSDRMLLLGEITQTQTEDKSGHISHLSIFLVWAIMFEEVVKF